MIDADAVLEAYDELRGRLPEQVPDGVRAELDGPLARTSGRPSRGFIEYQDLGGLEGAELDALIARQVRFFAERRESFEWKLHGHDLPADLPERLQAAGFVPEPQETVAMAAASAIAREPKLPDGVALRELTEAAEFERVAAFERRVWGGEDLHALAAMLTARRALDVLSLTVFAAEAGGEIVCAAWVLFEPGSPFAGLYGGATLAEWRGRGIYRALVARRANLAVERGCAYLQVDASDDSLPILERLGFVAVTTTTPFIWSP